MLVSRLKRRLDKRVTRRGTQLDQRPMLGSLNVAVMIPKARLLSKPVMMMISIQVTARPQYNCIWIWKIAWSEQENVCKEEINSKNLVKLKEIKFIYLRRTWSNLTQWTSLKTSAQIVAESRKQKPSFSSKLQNF